MRIKVIKEFLKRECQAFIYNTLTENAFERLSFFAPERSLPITNFLYGSYSAIYDARACANLIPNIINQNVILSKMSLMSKKHKLAALQPSEQLQQPALGLVYYQCTVLTNHV
jgi:hypothetical protein